MHRSKGALALLCALFLCAGTLLVGTVRAEDNAMAAPQGKTYVIITSLGYAKGEKYRPIVDQWDTAMMFLQPYLATHMSEGDVLKAAYIAERGEKSENYRCQDVQGVTLLQKLQALAQWEANAQLKNTYATYFQKYVDQAVVDHQSSPETELWFVQGKPVEKSRVAYVKLVETVDKAYSTVDPTSLLTLLANNPTITLHFLYTHQTNETEANGTLVRLDAYLRQQMPQAAARVVTHTADQLGEADGMRSPALWNDAMRGGARQFYMPQAVIAMEVDKSETFLFAHDPWGEKGDAALLVYCPSRDPEAKGVFDIKKLSFTLERIVASDSTSADQATDSGATAEGTETASPSVEPSVTPEASPSVEPSASPEASQSAEPSVTPEASPSVEPSASPEASQSVEPSVTPEASPSAEPSTSPETAAQDGSDVIDISGSIETPTQTPNTLHVQEDASVTTDAIPPAAETTGQAVPIDAAIPLKDSIWFYVNDLPAGQYRLTLSMTSDETLYLQPFSKVDTKPLNVTMELQQGNTWQREEQAVVMRTGAMLLPPESWQPCILIDGEEASFPIQYAALKTSESEYGWTAKIPAGQMTTGEHTITPALFIRDAGNATIMGESATVTLLNRKPEVNTDQATDRYLFVNVPANENRPLEVALSTLFSDPDGDVLTYLITEVAVERGNAETTYQPFTPTPETTDTPVPTVTAEAAEPTATPVLTQTPEATEQANGQASTDGAAPTESPEPTPAPYVIWQDANVGTLTLEQNGEVLRYTPANDNDGIALKVTLQAQDGDGELSEPLSVTIHQSRFDMALQRLRLVSTPGTGIIERGGAYQAQFDTESSIRFAVEPAQQADVDRILETVQAMGLPPLEWDVAYELTTKTGGTEQKEQATQKVQRMETEGQTWFGFEIPLPAARFTTSYTIQFQNTDTLNYQGIGIGGLMSTSGTVMVTVANQPIELSETAPFGQEQEEHTAELDDLRGEPPVRTLSKVLGQEQGFPAVESWFYDADRAQEADAATEGDMHYTLYVTAESQPILYIDGQPRDLTPEAADGYALSATDAKASFDIGFNTPGEYRIQLKATDSEQECTATVSVKVTSRRMRIIITALIAVAALAAVIALVWLIIYLRKPKFHQLCVGVYLTDDPEDTQIPQPVLPLYGYKKRSVALLPLVMAAGQPLLRPFSAEVLMRIFLSPAHRGKRCMLLFDKNAEFIVMDSANHKQGCTPKMPVRDDAVRIYHRNAPNTFLTLTFSSNGRASRKDMSL